MIIGKEVTPKKICINLKEMWISFTKNRRQIKIYKIIQIKIYNNNNSYPL